MNNMNFFKRKDTISHYEHHNFLSVWKRQLMVKDGQLEYLWLKIQCSRGCYPFFYSLVWSKNPKLPDPKGDWMSTSCHICMCYLTVHAQSEDSSVVATCSLQPQMLAVCCFVFLELWNFTWRTSFGNQWFSKPSVSCLAAVGQPQ